MPCKSTCFTALLAVFFTVLNLPDAEASKLLSSLLFSDTDEQESEAPFTPRLRTPTKFLDMVGSNVANVCTNTPCRGQKACNRVNANCGGCRQGYCTQRGGGSCNNRSCGGGNARQKDQRCRDWGCEFCNTNTNRCVGGRNPNPPNGGGCANNENALRTKLNQARPGDTVSICSNRSFVINGELTLSGRDITLRCQSSGSCVISKSGTGRILTVNGDNVAIQGIEFVDGDAGRDDGGAINMRSGTIRSCVFRRNKANNGGAVYSSGRTSVFDSRFTDGVASGRGGAAMIQVDRSSGNTFSNDRGRDCDNIYDTNSGSCQRNDGELEEMESAREN